MVHQGGKEVLRSAITPVLRAVLADGAVFGRAEAEAEAMAEAMAEAVLARYALCAPTELRGGGGLRTDEEEGVDVAAVVEGTLSAWHKKVKRGSMGGGGEDMEGVRVLAVGSLGEPDVTEAEREAELYFWKSRAFEPTTIAILQSGLSFSWWGGCLFLFRSF
jgi:hypothetical protein